MLQQIYGASEEAWLHFAQTLSLQGDLLPVVSDTNAKISAQSTMSALGKTPSCFNGRGEAVGIAGWTQKVATAEEIARWSGDSRLGICLQTRRVRAFDIDISDVDVAQAVSDFLLLEVGFMPCRTRSNSPKRLFIFSLVGDLPKRVCKTQGGMVEFLASGQQFVAVGTHTSGIRYLWQGGLPTEIPELTLAELDAVWAKLCGKFGVGPVGEVGASSVSRGQKLHQAIEADPVAQFILNNWQVKSVDRSGQINIVCPFEDSHSTGSGAVSSTSVFPAHTNGYSSTAVRCLHANCEHRTTGEFLEAMGYIDPLELAFEDLTAQSEEEETDTQSEESAEEKPKSKFQFVTAAAFAQQKPMKWLIRNVLPAADLGMIFGPSGAGKSFVALEMLCAIARGIPWQGNRVSKGRVAYVAAEGSHGLKSRLHAYSVANGIPLTEIDILILDHAPNLLAKADIVDIAKALARTGVTAIVVDTFASSFAGGSENSADDVGTVVNNCRKLGRVLKATVLLIHHTGKTIGSSPQARGSSAMKAAMDVEIYVARDKEAGTRHIETTKMKEGSDESDILPFGLEYVITGYDDEGEAITSCVCDFGGA